MCYGQKGSPIFGDALSDALSSYRKGRIELGSGRSRSQGPFLGQVMQKTGRTCMISFVLHPLFRNPGSCLPEMYVKWSRRGFLVFTRARGLDRWIPIGGSIRTYPESPKQIGGGSPQGILRVRMRREPRKTTHQIMHRHL